MMKTDKKQAALVIFLCSAVYMISYVTRNSYNAIISEMVTSLGQPKSALGVALTGAFITYGAGQLVSGWFGDKVQPRTLIALGLAATSCMNLLIPLCQNTVQMTVVWCVNGFAQSFMWPPIVKLLFVALSSEDYSRGCVRVSWGSSIGNIFVYLTAPLMILLLGWRSVFGLSSFMGILGLIFWLRLCPKIDLTPRKREKQAGGKVSGTAMALTLILVMLGIILQGILKDGVTTWTPSYLSETFGLQNELSILAGVLLPLFSIFCYSLGNWMYRKVKNPLICSCVIFGIATLVCGVLYLFYDGSALVSVSCAAIITGCMHGVNLMLIGIAPTVLARSGNVSTYSGVLNCTAYIGSAISSWVIPLVTENAGWNSTILMWLGICAAGVVCCLGCVRLWKRVQTDS